MRLPQIQSVYVILLSYRQKIPRASLSTCIVAFFCTLSVVYFHSITVHLSAAYMQRYPLPLSKSVPVKKTILIWTKWNNESPDFDKNQPAFFEHCPQPNCTVTRRRYKRKEADALLFFMADFQHNDLPDPSKRSPRQYYIFYGLESPDTYKELAAYQQWDVVRNLFNLTLSYRTDSDIFTGYYLDGYQPHIINTKERDPLWFFGRRDVLWMASHCNTKSKREEYVRELQKHVQVDVLGRCGEGNVREHCLNGVCAADKEYLSRYKFYLAFENSICKDYATEKLIRALNHDVVPVVMGGLDYAKLFPPKAVINIGDYSSPEELAQYLKYLIKNTTAYEEHLKWKYPGKELWHLPGIPDRKHTGWCGVCEHLHRPPAKQFHKSYYSIVDWYFKDQCAGDYRALLSQSNKALSLIDVKISSSANKTNAFCV